MPTYPLLNPSTNNILPLTCGIYYTILFIQLIVQICYELLNMWYAVLLHMLICSFNTHNRGQTTVYKQPVRPTHKHYQLLSLLPLPSHHYHHHHHRCHYYHHHHHNHPHHNHHHHCFNAYSYIDWEIMYFHSHMPWKTYYWTNSLGQTITLQTTP